MMVAMTCLQSHQVSGEFYQGKVGRDVVQGDIGVLHDQPRHHDVRDRDSKNVSALEFVE